MNSDFVFWPFFPKAFCLRYFLTRWLVSECLSPCERGSRQGRCSLRMQPVFSALCMEGRARGCVYCMAERGTLVAAEEAPAGSVLIEQSSLRRGSIGLCCLLAQTDPQSCWAALWFFAFFLPEGFIFFHVSTFHLSPWARNDYHLNNYTSVCFYSSYLAGL